jgi:hypothetical protein
MRTSCRCRSGEVRPRRPPIDRWNDRLLLKLYPHFTLQPRQSSYSRCPAQSTTKYTGKRTYIECLTTLPTAPTLHRARTFACDFALCRLHYGCTNPNPRSKRYFLPAVHRSMTSPLAEHSMQRCRQRTNGQIPGRHLE